MRGITTAVFFTVAIIVVAAAPKSTTNSQQWGKNKKVAGTEGSSIFPSDRTRPSSPLPSRRKSGGGTAGPYLFFREPKALGREAAWNVNSGSIGNSWVRGGQGQGQGGVGQSQNYPQTGYWPRYGFAQRGRDDEEESDEEEEDAEDDIGDDSGSEEDEVAFDTPSWDSIYPPSETGGYARQNEPSESGSGSSWHQKPTQQQIVSDGSYSLSAGSPGGPSSYQGRSGYKNGPWAGQWSPKKNWVQGGSGRRQVRRGPPPSQQWYGDEEIEGPTPWYGQSQGQSQRSPSRWSNNVIYAQQPQPGPEYVRRSWNWRPSGPPPPRRIPQIEQVDSDEESGEGGNIWQGQPQPQPQIWSGSGSGGPRRVVKNWARTPTPTWGPRQSQKFGYY